MFLIRIKIIACATGEEPYGMAMAAAVAMQYGADIEVIDPEVVQKSFAKFWEIL